MGTLWLNWHNWCRLLGRKFQSADLHKTSARLRITADPLTPSAIPHHKPSQSASDFILTVHRALPEHSSACQIFICCGTRASAASKPKAEDTVKLLRLPNKPPSAARKCWEGNPENLRLVFFSRKRVECQRKHGLMSMTVLFLIGHRGGFTRESLMNQMFVLSLANRDSAEHAESSDN